MAIGEAASGRIRHVERRNDDLIAIAGDLVAPEPGRFFFQKQTQPGVAGRFVGVVELPQSGRAWRLEPSKQEGETELVERPLEEVLCGRLPRPAEMARGTGGTNRPDTAVRNRPVSQAIPPLKPGDYPDMPVPVYQNGIIALESLHGATAVIYLDFQGGYTPTWGGVTYARPYVSNAQIRDVWERVAEDFMPFNINVTTDLGVFQNAPEGSRQRVIITPTTVTGPDQGGVAYMGSFNWTGDTPCWVFLLTGKYCAEACSHEIGHTLGLSHTGQNNVGGLVEYYSGHGSGETGWTPIMGLGYYENVSQWSKGEYTNANNQVDDLAQIATGNNNVGFRPDDAGGTLASARYLEVYPDFSAGAGGVIERTGDTDAFQFSTTGGPISLRADPVGAGPNLAVAVGLYDAGERLLASNSPNNTLWASIATNLPAGTYTFRIQGAGRNNPLNSGFSSYGSLGYYSVTGSVANARLPNRFTLTEHSPNGTVVGVLPVDNPAQHPLTFAIGPGNTGNTFAIDSAGTLIIADNRLLDYAALAAKTSFTVQFELLVNITDLQNGALNEANRRVIVAILPGQLTITQQPGTVTAPAGGDVSLNVGVTGPTPLLYEWFFNDSSLGGANAPTLVLANVQSRHSGEYRVVVSSPLAAVTSTVATLTVTSAAPIIVEQPRAQGAFVGFGAGMTVRARGSEPLNYQWQLNGCDIPAATNTSLALPSVQTAQAGLYRVVVSNNAGQTASAAALLALVPVASWGWNGGGQTNIPVELTNAVQVAAGPAYNLALRRDGLVVAWGGTNQAAGIAPGVSNAMAVAAGGVHALALKSDYTVQAWGDNSSGQSAVPADLGNVVAIAAGGAHSLALRSDGTVRAWGSNANGQTNVPWGLTNVVAIAAGSNFCLALREDGRIAAWGENSFGQVEVAYFHSNAVAIAAGGGHGLALKRDGTVEAWAGYGYGQGNVPSGLSDVVAIAGGAYDSLALRGDGTLAAWGAGVAATTSFPRMGQSLIPVSVTNTTGISGGAARTLVLQGEGAPFINQPPVGRTITNGWPTIFRVSATGALPLAYQWQFNGTNLPGATGQMLALERAEGQGFYAVVVSNFLGAVTSAPAKLTLIDSAPIIATQPTNYPGYLGGQAKLEVAAYGTGPLAYQWWFNGQALPGATTSTLNLTRLRPDMAGDYYVSLSNALGTINSTPAKVDVAQVVAWSYAPYIWAADYGQMTVPAGLTGVVQIAAGAVHSLALKANGTVVAWGGVGQSFGQALVPPNLSNVVAVAGGQFHSLALKANGTVVGWGGGSFEGWPNYGQSKPPVGLNDAVAIVAGNTHSAALRADGRVTAWGYITQAPAGLTNATAIAAGDNGMLVLKRDGSVIGWGNYNGVQFDSAPNAVALVAVSSCLALNDDGTVKVLNPGYLPGDATNLVEIAASSDSYLGLRSDGSIVMWGWGGYCGSTNIPPGLTNVIGVAVGYYHFMALLGNGSPVIKFPPRPRVTAAGGDATFRVLAVGAPPLAFQWQFNGTNLPGATAASLPLGNVQPDQVGNYRVVVSNAFDVVTSASAGLSLLPSLAQQPISQTVTNGATVQLTVDASGTPPLTYQWSKEGACLSGATRSVLQITNASRHDSGVYSAAVSNPAGTVWSSNAVLRVLVRQKLAIPSPQADGTLLLLSRDADGSALWSDDLAGFEAQASTNLRDWTTLTNALGLTNGALWLSDPQPTNHPGRFYRILER